MYKDTNGELNPPTWVPDMVSIVHLKYGDNTFHSERDLLYVCVKKKPPKVRYSYFRQLKTSSRLIKTDFRKRSARRRSVDDGRNERRREHVRERMKKRRRKMTTSH